MAIFIGGRSALAFWRTSQNRNALTPTKARPRQGFALKCTELKELDLENLGIADGPITLLVASPAERRPLKSVRCCVWEGSALAGSFVKVSPDVYVSTPEAVFLQLAKQQDLVDLIKLGMELCGTYSIDLKMEGGFSTRPALTSTLAIKRYLDKAAGVRGVKIARQALGYIADGSASPAETNAVILLCLPTSLGGFGLPKPELNRRFELPGNAKALARQRSFKCDMYWPQIHMAIEYDSDFWHSGETRHTSDSVRRNAIEHLGLTVITMTRGQLYDARETERIAGILMRRLHRYHPSVRKDLLARRYELRRAVLG